MRYGFLLAFRNPPRWRLPWTEIYRQHIEQAEFAEALGFDEVWLTEHHFVEDGWSPSLLPIASALAMRTQKIRIGTFVMLLPLGKHPVQVAEDATTVDILSNGRLDLGLGLGYRREEFAGYGVSRKQRRGRMEEGLEIIRRAWSEETFSFEGKYFNLENVSMMPRPVQSKPPIWVGGMTEASVLRAAKFKFHLAGTGAEQLQKMYDDALKKSGEVPADFRISQLRLTFLAESKKEAWDLAEEHIYYMLDSYDRWYKAAADSEDLKDTMSVSSIPEPPKLRETEGLSFFGAPLIVGTPEDAIEELSGYAERSRVTDLVFWTQLAGMDTHVARRSMQLLAEEVLPNL